MENIKLIEQAALLVKPKEIHGGICGDVASVVISENGNMYKGVCADIGSNVCCAEQAALMNMITNGEYKFKTIVAVWKDQEGEIFVIPPCGNCRQFMKEIDEENLSAKIILDKEKSVDLKELLPYNDWWKKQ